MRRHRHTTVAVLALAALSGCADDGGTAGRESDRTTTPTSGDDDARPIDVSADPSVEVDGGGGGSGRLRGLRLAPFDDCDAFLGHVQQEAGARVGPYGLDGSGVPWPSIGMVEMTAEADFAEATVAPSAVSDVGISAPTSSDAGLESASDDSSQMAGTNTQESGVDEPDLMKTDGRRIVTISQNVLTVVDITGATPVVTGHLHLAEGSGHQVFLHGDHVIVVTNSGGWAVPVDLPVPAPATTAPADAEAAFAVDSTMPPTTDVVPVDPFTPGPAPAAMVVDVDLSATGTPTIAATLRIEGQYLSARVIDGRMLLAVTTGPGSMPWLIPQSPSGEERATEANRAVVDESQLSDWMPQYELVAGDSVSTGDVLGCDRVHHPAEFSGFDMISVVEVDLTDGLATGFVPGTGTGVLASGQTVYASLDRMYVATTRWAGTDELDDAALVETWTEDYETDIHAFSITAGSPVTYVASGSVDGTLLNQFSMDEHLGNLRVFATDGTPWDQSDLSETRLVVLAEQDDLLVPIGEVGGLGRGEALYAARLMGDRGFAVTFRQTDPFYVLDLSDPTAPRVAGELKIPGFSTYLHPVGDHRVLGVGRAATDDGIVTGLKLSLFDVSDPSSPAEIAVWTLDGASSPAEYDHHAFQMIGSTAILPVQSYVDDFNGAIVFEVGDTIAEVGRITHATPDAEPVGGCRRIGADDVGADSPIAWAATDPYMWMQLCGPDAATGHDDWYCDVVPFEDTAAWFGTDLVAEELATLGAEPGHRLEMCYRTDAGWSDAIIRSVVVDSTLWTMSTNRLEGNDLTTLAPIGGVGLL